MPASVLQYIDHRMFLCGKYMQSDIPSVKRCEKQMDQPTISFRHQLFLPGCISLGQATGVQHPQELLHDNGHLPVHLPGPMVNGRHIQVAIPAF